LLDNSFENSHLLPELKNIPYLLIIKGAIDFLQLDELIQKIKTINGVQLVSKIDISKLKSIAQLILPESKSQKLLL
jgi:hypothetical protein